MKEENNCKLVSSHGIMKIVSQRPIFPKNGKNVEYKFNTKNKKGESVYVRTCDIDWFFSKWMDQFENPIVLVTGDHTMEVPTFMPFFEEYCKHKNLLHWYAQNYVEKSTDKVSHLPLGLDYHTLSMWNTHRWGKKMTPVDQENELFAIKKTFLPIHLCISNKVLCNFQHSTYGNPVLRMKRRIPILKELENNSCVTFLPEQKRVDFWKELKYYAFVISPIGFGIDTHRTYEILALGRIPIICKTGINGLFSDLPVVEIDDWSNLDEAFLQKEFKIKKNQWSHYNWEKMNLQFWKDEISQFLE